MALTIKQADFWTPELPVLAAALQDGLSGNYAQARVAVGPCPDLQQLGCAFAGLNGEPFLVEIGGEPYVHNPRHRPHGSFDLDQIMTACGRPDAKVLGAGFPSLVATGGKCGELMPCLAMRGRNASKIAKVGPARQCIVEDYDSHLHGGLGNLYASDGAGGDVLHVEVKKRTGGQASLTQAMRAALAPLVRDAAGRELALGGVFSVLAGQVRAHISPDFACIPFAYYDPGEERAFRQDFLQFYDGMGPELTCMGVLWTGDPTGGALNLRPTCEHTHFFSAAGRAEAGHYHYDVSPDAIHCRGYFQLARRVARVADIYEQLGKPLPSGAAAGQA